MKTKRRNRRKQIQLDCFSDKSSSESSENESETDDGFRRVSINVENEYPEDTVIEELLEQGTYTDGSSTEDETANSLCEIESSSSIGSNYQIDSDISSGTEQENEDVSNEINEKEDYRVLCYTNFVISEGLSEKTVKRMEALMTVLYNFPPPVTYSHIKKKLNALCNKTIKEVHYYCHSCGLKKKEKNFKCGCCELMSTNLSDTVTLVTCDYEFQLRSFLKHHGNEIIDAHRGIHSKNETFKDNDIRICPGYKKLIESETEFQNRKINLICTLNSDGARFKRMSKSVIF